MRRRCFIRRIGLLAALLSMASSFVGHAADLDTANTAAVAAEATWDHAQRRHRQYKEIIQGRDHRIVFLGDSITEQWATVGRDAWEAHFAPLGARNLGIAGDRTQHVLWRLENGALDQCRVELIVLLIGTNNIKEQRNTPRETAEGVRVVLERLYELAPDSRVLLMGILPCGSDATSPQRCAANEVNESLAQMADGDRVTYVDTAPALLTSDGKLPEQWSPDGLHLSAEGYSRVAEVLRPIVMQMLTERTVMTPKKRG